MTHRHKPTAGNTPGLGAIQRDSFLIMKTPRGNLAVNLNGRIFLLKKDDRPYSESEERELTFNPLTAWGQLTAGGRMPARLTPKRTARIIEALLEAGRISEKDFPEILPPLKSRLVKRKEVVINNPCPISGEFVKINTAPFIRMMLENETFHKRMKAAV